MLRSILLTAWRNLIRRKDYSILNILGLSAGIAACLLIVLFISDELSYDNYHQDLDRIYRVVIDWYGADGSVYPGFCTIAPRFETYLESDIPGILTASRVMNIGDYLVKVGDKHFFEKDIYLADPDIFDVLTLPILAGNIESALSKPNNMMLTRSMAEKFFGDINPIGKEVLLDGTDPYIVSGVIEDIPRNSHVHFGILLPIDAIKEGGGEWYRKHFESDAFTDNYTATYIKLTENSSPEEVQAQIPGMLDIRVGDKEMKDGSVRKASERIRLTLQPLDRIHLISHQQNEYEPNGDIRQVRLFAIIAGGILLLACVNFINLSTAGASKRAREVGLRKVVGAQRPILLLQFFGETIMIALAAFLIAVIAVEAVLPVFNNFIQRELVLSFGDINILLYFLGLFIFVGIIAGLYPALYLTSYRPATILRGELTRGRKGAIARKGLVIFQFAVTVVLIICINVISAQIRYLYKMDLGFAKDNVVLFSFTPELREHWATAKDKLNQLPGVLSACKSKRVPSGILADAPGFKAQVNGKLVSSPFGSPHIRMDFGFLETYGIKLAAGRDFSTDFASDSTEAYIINETAAKALGFGDVSEAVGIPFQAMGRGEGKIIGVVKDFHYESLHNKIIPVVMYPSREANTVSVRVQGADLDKTLAGIQSVWNEFNPGFPFEYDFIDARLAALYSSEGRLMKLVSAFSILAILIACLGLYGLSSFTAEWRQREIGIRKTFGASVSGLVRLLTAEFTTLVIIGSVIAVPLAYFAMKSWLDGFAYKTPLQAGYFVIAIVIALSLAFIAVAYQTLRAALADPVEVLRKEN